MKFLDNLIPLAPSRSEERLSVSDYAKLVSFGGNQYDVPSMSGSKPDVADSSFVSMVQKVHQRSGVVSSAVFTRSLLLSQVRFVFKPIGESVVASAPDTGGSNADLRRLDRPGSTTRPTMLKRMEQDVSYAGNSVIVTGKNRKLYRLEPYKVSFVLGSDEMPTWKDNGEMMTPYDAEVVAYIYNPNEDQADKRNLKVFYPNEVSHFMPEPDPLHFWRGSSWVESLLRDVALGGQIDDHQAKFFENAATPKMVFIADGTRTQDELEAAAASVNQRHAGSANAHRNMFIGGISDVRVIGQDFSKIGFKDLEGSIEIATAMRSRVPASVLGTRDSLDGSSLNAGNYDSARRMLANGWFSPTVEDLCASLESIAQPPAGKMLGADLSRVLFLQEDASDQSLITQTQMAAIRNAVDGGFTPESATKAVTSGDLLQLDHTGLLSVQLQKPGSAQESPKEPTDVGT
ncbi:phage portal protein [Ilumatobacter sp.]|uniref:phage portal protein n=1 Tax=Ilumatobacter sp. TaxID=1967498 RepID=UPI003751035A